MDFDSCESSFGIVIPIVKRYKGSVEDLAGAKGKNASNKTLIRRLKSIRETRLIPSFSHVT
ncbi:MAG: hypothetical protein HUJ51_05855 [Eggerthellaceae bacterium]|nr:hypothetical protein [Eggerthellaceae bacterium]